MNETNRAASPAEVVRVMVLYLGCILIEEMTGATGPDLRRWLEDGVISVEQEALIRTGYEAFQTIAGVEDPFTARSWMFGMNPQLDDECPIVLVRQGRGRDVLVAARAYVNG